MVIIQAKVIIFKSRYVTGNELMSGIKCPIRFSGSEPGYGYTCRLTTESGIPIPVDAEAIVDMEVLYGEIILDKLLESVEFEFAYSNPVGKGKIIKIKEICIDKTTMESLNDLKMVREIVEYAEKLPNTTIFDDVYDLLK